MTPQDNGGRRIGSVRVRDFETPTYLRQGRIVYRESPTQVGYYDYHRWVTNPGATVTTAIIGGLRSTGLFSEVDSDASHMKTDFLLTGRLERLDEIEYGGGVRVEVKMSAQLVDLRTKATVWSGEEAETATVEKANAKKGSVNLVVIEMSHAAQKCIDRLLANMQQQLGSAAQPSANSQIPRPEQYQDFRYQVVGIPSFSVVTCKLTGTARKCFLLAE